MVRFSKKEMRKASKKIREDIKNGKGLPKTLKMTDMAEGKIYDLDKSMYNGLFEAQNVFIRKHGRYPSYVTLNSKANNPLVLDYQDNKYNCCPTSVSMASQMLYDNVSEAKCARVLGTNTSGTSPAQLMNNIKKLGMKASIINRNAKSVRKSLKQGCPVIAHIQTKPATCLGYLNDYGHYILIYAVSATGQYKIADPTKGFKKCKPSVLDNATNGRDIYYYSISPF